MAEFEWPCDKREAHGPHPIACTCMGVEVHMPSCQRRYGSSCPGVKAHPDTMIGRAVTHD